MSKHRTKVQKQAAHNHYQLGNWFSEPKPKARGKTRQEQTGVTALTLYGYEPSLISKDLWRTVGMVTVILILEILIYRFWI
jgi:hypothetical protein